MRRMPEDPFLGRLVGRPTLPAPHPGDLLTATPKKPTLSVGERGATATKHTSSNDRELNKSKSKDKTSTGDLGLPDDDYSKLEKDIICKSRPRNVQPAPNASSSDGQQAERHQ